MHRTMALFLLFCFAIFSTAAGVENPAQIKQGDSAQLKPQTTCPVMGRVVNRRVFLDYQGKRIYFACAGGLMTFKNDPAFYLKKMAEMGEYPIAIPEPVPQKACPVDGGSIDSSLYCDYNGERIYGCTKACLEKIVKKPEKYRTKIIAAGQWPRVVEKEDTAGAVKK